MAKTPMDLEEWKDQFSQHLIEIIFKCLQDEEAERGYKYSNEIAGTFLARFIGGIVYNALKHRPKGIKSDAMQERYTIEEFRRVKLKIEESIVAGFQGAFTEFSGHPCEYFCQIHPVPEVANKEPI